MLKRAVTSSGFDSNLQAALNATPDYSETFSSKVQSLARDIGNALSAPLEHDDDMNYSAAQKITIFLGQSCQPVPATDRDVTFRLIDFISSKGPYFTFITLKISGSTMGWREKGLEEPREYWFPLQDARVPEGIGTLQKRVASLMESKGYARLEGPLLSQPVEGKVTQLDGQPATVFAVLFTEVI